MRVNRPETTVDSLHINMQAGTTHTHTHSGTRAQFVDQFGPGNASIQAAMCVDRFLVSKAKKKNVIQIQNALDAPVYS